MKSNKFHGKLFSDNLKNGNILPFSKLQVFDISHNNFTGPLPHGYFKNFVAMMNVKINGTEERNGVTDPVILVLMGYQQKLAGILVTSTVIDFSDNQFSGSIPPEIGNLNSLMSLQLKSNNLTGQIPSSICNLTSLESLHLSENKLQGTIPQCLGNFSTSLSVLALKGNQLRGPIPTTFVNGNKLKYLNLNGNKLQGPLPKSLRKCQRLEVLDIVTR
ncbi:hypothetical protein CDL12_27086 [Handroanthus impetiginosus]|uniref:Non-specific serine/threonine protein kinase n=1 Tax=Handroanthus impetiginosus TaxID=429701 RepID=A0A2G9G532_9LAMI|nr:hypothetical protein CDL12_27086 [Handroanthus impetiginosus]